MPAFIRHTDADATAIILSTSGSNAPMLLRDLVRSHRWTIIESVDTIEPVILAIEKNRARLIIIDDSPEMPGSFLLRRLMKNPICMATPTLCLSSMDDKPEVNVISQVSNVSITPKPLTPDKFFPTFNELNQKWSTGFYALLRQAIAQILGGKHETGLRMLTKLNEHRGARLLVAPILAHYYQITSNFVTAEKILLATLKENPRSISLVFSMTELYVNASMPMMAYRLLTGARAHFGSAAAILTELTQVCLLLNKIDEALVHLTMLHEAGFDPQQVPLSIARLLYAEGRQSEVSKYISRNSLLQKFEQSWTPETPPPPIANAS